MTFATRIVFYRGDIANAINDMVTNLGWTFVSMTYDTGNGGSPAAFVLLFQQNEYSES